MRLNEKPVSTGTLITCQPVVGKELYRAFMPGYIYQVEHVRRSNIDRDNYLYKVKCMATGRKLSLNESKAHFVVLGIETKDAAFLNSL